jgi:serine/threonine-protein kinase
VGETTVAVLMAHIIQAAPHASEVCAELSPLLDAPLLAMLDKDPEKRPSSAGEAVAALRRAALDSGASLSDAGLRLPKPETPLPSDSPRSGEPDTLLDDMSPSGRDAVQAASTGSNARPLWPFALGLLGLGALLGFAVLRPSEPPRADAVPSITPPVASVEAAAAPSAVEPSLSAVPAPSAVPSASVAPSSAPAAQRPTDSGKAKAPRVAASARIPTDLENPF